jgi:hypothetical protein
MEDDCWTSYTYTKQNDETSCNCFKWGEREWWGELMNVQCKAIEK